MSLAKTGVFWLVLREMSKKSKRAQGRTGVFKLKEVDTIEMRMAATEENPSGVEPPFCPLKFTIALRG